MSPAKARVVASVVVVLVAVGAIYAAARFGVWQGIIATVGRPPAPDGVEAGFIGVANFGQWRLICVRGPTLATPGESASSVTAANACRINLELRVDERPNEVIVSANLRLVGPLRQPALMLRLPGTFNTGNAIALDLGERILETTVRDCAPEECMAASTLSDSDWNYLTTAKSMKVIFPLAGGQSAFVNLPVEGLADAAAALERAEIAPN